MPHRAGEKLKPIYQSPVYKICAVIMLSALPSLSLACGWWGENIDEPDDAIEVGPSEEAKPDLSTPEGMAWISTAYRLGNGVPQDDVLARFWAKRGALAGHIGAMNDYGQFLETGLGGAVDEEVAVIWYKKAADLEFAYAQHSLANMYMDGRGIPKDSAEAEYWLRRAASKHHPSASAQLANFIWRGNMTTKENNEGCFWWMVALNNGYSGNPDQCLVAEPDLTEADVFELKMRAFSHSLKQ